MDKQDICPVLYRVIRPAGNPKKGLGGLWDSMFEIARNLEQMAVRFNPVILVGPGLVAVLLGLFVWLGGLGFRKVLAAVLGAVCGGVCGLFITVQNILPAIILAVVVAVIAVILQRVFMTILAVVLAAVFCFAVLVVPYIESGEEDVSISRDKTENRAELSIQQSVKIIEEYITGSIAEIKRILFYVPVRKQAIGGVLVLVFIMAFSFQSRLTSAFSCAAFGTALIFAGMILLLLYKGAAPVSRIILNLPFYLGVFAAMTAFGMTEQLLLCPGIKRKSKDEKKTDDSDKKEPENISQSWRTS